MKREIKNSRPSTVHMAGIIPVHGQSLEFNFPWHDCMIPIAPNFLAIERAVLECATAGCKTIWIICPNPMQPLLKARLGDYVHDPYFLKTSIYRKMPSIHRKLVPIYYIPAHPKDKNKRDSLVWSILYGVKVVRKLSLGFSKWLVPLKYYITFPYGVFPSQYLIKNRTTFNRSKLILAKFQGKSIKDGEYLPCVLTYEHILFLTKIFREKATLVSKSSEKESIYDFPSIERLPLEQRYSGRFLTIADIFQHLDDTNASEINILWHYDISNWNNYRKFLASTDADKIKRPFNTLLPIIAQTLGKISIEEISREDKNEIL